jgi:hypothetical protein
LRGLLGIVLLSALVCVGAASSVRATTSVPAPGSYRENAFDVDPQWEGVRNRARSIKCAARTFAFGWKRGEIGGRVERSSYYRAYYAKALPEPRSLDDPLTVSAVVRLQGGSSGGVLFGWFNSRTSFDWRTQDYLAIRLDGEGRRAAVYGEYGTQNTFTRSVTTREHLLPKRPQRLTLEYLPGAGEQASGLVRLTVGGSTAEISLRPEQRADGATFDRFGFLNVQVDGDPITAYVSDLTLDGEHVDLAADPGWEGSNNSLGGAQDCFRRNRQDFGFSGDTHLAGGEAGEVGGLVWRSSASKAKASYADVTADLGLNDVLYAEGSIVVERASSDSDVFIGWFNSASVAPTGLPTHILAANLGGPSEWGHRLYPVYRTGGDRRDAFSDHRNAPRVTPKHRVWRWWICYLPTVDLDGNGRLTVGLIDPAEELPASEASIRVSRAAKEAGAVFNRFGIRNYEHGGHSVVFYVDDIRYTVGGGDVVPAGRCGG